MLRQILIGSALFFATTIVHAACTVIALHSLKAFRVRLESLTWGGVLTGVLVIMMSLAAILEALIWALVYVGVGAIDGLETALYFSIVTFTTLGYGDIVLDEGWRLLSALQAANGIIMFGWTTALIFAFVQHVHSRRKASRQRARQQVP